MSQTGPRRSRGSRQPSKRPSVPKPSTSKPSTQFSTFIDLIRKAGLESALNSAGPYTIFVITNSTFEKIHPDSMKALLKNPDALKKLLLYHIVSGRHMSDELVNLNGKFLTSVQGERVPIQVSNGQIKVGTANIVQPDVKAMNGVIHVIDGVMVPSGQQGDANYQATAPTTLAPSTPAPAPVATGQPPQQVGPAVAQAYAFQSSSWIVWIIIIIIILLLLWVLFMSKPAV